MTDSDGASTIYEITDRIKVAKGDCDPDWLDQTGPHRLALFTCDGLVDGEFTKSTATFATPVSRA